jgi:predicted dehydrogenase
MAGNSVDAERLVQAAADKGVHYVVGYMKRYDEGVQNAKRILDEALDSGDLGDLIYARSHCFTGDSYCNPWGHVITDEKVDYSNKGWEIAPCWLAEEWKQPFHVYINTYSHNTNLLRYLLGKNPTVVSANVARENGQIAVLDFDGFLGVVETGMASNRGWDEVTEFFFTDGRITIKTPPALMRNTPATVEVYRAGKTQELRVPQAYWSWSFRRQAEAFIGDLLADRESISSAADSVEDLRLIEEMWRNDPVIASSMNSLGVS